MKKIRWLSCFLALVLMFQGVCLPVLAEETTVPTTQGETEPEAQDSVVSKVNKNFGTVSIQNGCRTINGQVPLGGSERKLDTAQAAFLYEANTQTVLYAYNADNQLHPGTLTKMVTALVAIEHCDNLNEQVTISTLSYAKSLPAGAQNAKLKEGEHMSVKDLLYLVLLAQANDAAISLAEHIAGTEQAFLDLMNQRVQEMGCTNTIFANVHGQHNNPSVSTARDLAKIMVEAMKNDIFVQITQATNYDVPATDRSDVRKLLNTNYMISDNVLQDFYDKHVTGGLAAYDPNNGIGAGLITTWENEGMQLVGVVLGCLRVFQDGNNWKPEVYGNFNEMTDLLKFGYEKYKVNQILYPDMTLKQFPVSGGECNVVGVTQDEYPSAVPISASMDNLVFRYYVKDLKAPIAAGEKIGTAEIWYRDSCMAETEMFAMGPVTVAGKNGVTIHATAARSDREASGFLSILGTICVIILGLVVLYLVFNAYMRSRMRARRRRRREARRRAR